MCCAESIPEEQYNPEIKGFGFVQNPDRQQYCFDESTTKWYNEIDEITYHFQCISEGTKLVTTLVTLCYAVYAMA